MRNHLVFNPSLSLWRVWEVMRNKFLIPSSWPQPLPSTYEAAGAVSLPWAFHKPRMNGCLFSVDCSCFCPSPVPSTPLRTPVPHFELEGIGWDSLAFLQIAFQLPQLLKERCTPCICNITIKKLTHYIRVRLDFVSVGMTIMFFFLVLILPSTPKIFRNFCVSRTIFSDLQLSYSTLDICMIQYRLRTAFCLKISTGCIFLQFCLPSN